MGCGINARGPRRPPWWSHPRIHPYGVHTRPCHGDPEPNGHVHRPARVPVGEHHGKSERCAADREDRKHGAAPDVRNPEPAPTTTADAAHGKPGGPPQGKGDHARQGERPPQGRPATLPSPARLCRRPMPHDLGAFLWVGEALATEPALVARSTARTSVERERTRNVMGVGTPVG